MNERYTKYLSDAVFYRACHAILGLVVKGQLKIDDIDLIKEIVIEKMEVIEKNNSSNNTINNNSGDKNDS